MHLPRQRMLTAAFRTASLSYLTAEETAKALRCTACVDQRLLRAGVTTHKAEPARGTFDMRVARRSAVVCAARTQKLAKCPWRKRLPNLRNRSLRKCRSEGDMSITSSVVCVAKVASESHAPHTHTVVRSVGGCVELIRARPISLASNGIIVELQCVDQRLKIHQFRYLSLNTDAGSPAHPILRRSVASHDA